MRAASPGAIVVTRSTSTPWDRNNSQTDSIEEDVRDPYRPVFGLAMRRDFAFDMCDQTYYENKKEDTGAFFS
jgi:hypothetical protein